jgi:hypothetical protein
MSTRQEANRRNSGIEDSRREQRKARTASRRRRRRIARQLGTACPGGVGFMRRRQAAAASCVQRWRFRVYRRGDGGFYRSLQGMAYMG